MSATSPLPTKLKISSCVRSGNPCSRRASLVTTTKSGSVSKMVPSRSKMKVSNVFLSLMNEIAPSLPCRETRQIEKPAAAGLVKRQRACSVAARFSMERVTGLMLRFAKPNPPSQAQSDEFLKTLHWSVFLTEFHLIGSSPCSCSNGNWQCACSVATMLSMERVTGLEPANTSLGSSGLTTWRHPHQVTDYTLSARKGIERFQKAPYSACFPR